MNPRIHHRNAAPVKRKKKVKEKEKNEYELCKVCKINHNLGRRHNFYPNHIKSLSSFLSRFQTKLSDVRFFLKNPTILLPEHAARNRLWCVFCDFELDEIDSSFAWSVSLSLSPSFTPLLPPSLFSPPLPLSFYLCTSLYHFIVGCY